MPCYFDKTWWLGDDPSCAKKPLDVQWSKPVYRPGWRVKFRKLGRVRIGKIQYVHRTDEHRLDFYLVIRESTGEKIITFDCEILQKLEKQV